MLQSSASVIVSADGFLPLTKMIAHTPAISHVLTTCLFVKPVISIASGFVNGCEKASTSLIKSDAFAYLMSMSSSWHLEIISAWRSSLMVSSFTFSARPFWSFFFASGTYLKLVLLPSRSFDHDMCHRRSLWMPGHKRRTS